MNNIESLDLPQISGTGIEKFQYNIFQSAQPCNDKGTEFQVTKTPHISPHDDVIKWKHFPRYWPFVLGIHRSRWIPRTKASDGELLMFSLICARINDSVNNREAGDLRPHCGHYDVNGMFTGKLWHVCCDYFVKRRKLLLSWDHILFTFSR